MDTGPVFRLKAAGLLLYLANRNWVACPAKSSAMLLATLGRYMNKLLGRCRLTVERMLFQWLVHIYPPETACKLKVLNDRKNVPLDDYLGREAAAR